MGKDFEKFVKDLENSGEIKNLLSNMMNEAERKQKETRKEIIPMLKIQRDTIYGASQGTYIDLMSSEDWSGANMDNLIRLMKLMELLTNIIEKMEREELREEGA